jgi:translation initiation factor IF-2
LDLAKLEMLVISIGEPISPNLLLSVRKARERNVSIKMIAHKYDKDNKDVLENLKKNGYEIRHHSDWGFHMAIYDQAKTLLIINNPENTSERVAMFINSSGLSKALHDYFFSVWKKAKIV